MSERMGLSRHRAVFPRRVHPSVAPSRARK